MQRDDVNKQRILAHQVVCLNTENTELKWISDTDSCYPLDDSLLGKKQIRESLIALWITYLCVQKLLLALTTQAVNAPVAGGWIDQQQQLFPGGSVDQRQQYSFLVVDNLSFGVCSPIGEASPSVRFPFITLYLLQ